MESGMHDAQWRSLTKIKEKPRTIFLKALINNGASVQFVSK
jgi:hypothetical protein